MIFSYKNILIVLFAGFLPLSADPIIAQMWTRQTSIGLQKVGLIILGDRVDTRTLYPEYLDEIDRVVETQNRLSDVDKARNKEELGAVAAIFCDFDVNAVSSRRQESAFSTYKWNACETFCCANRVTNVEKFKKNFGELIGNHRKILIVCDVGGFELIDPLFILNGFYPLGGVFEDLYKRSFAHGFQIVSDLILANTDEQEDSVSNVIGEGINLANQVQKELLQNSSYLTNEYIHAFINDLLICCNYCGKRTNKRCAYCHLARYREGTDCRKLDFANHHEFCLEADLQV